MNPRGVFDAWRSGLTRGNFGQVKDWVVLITGVQGMVLLKDLGAFLAPQSGNASCELLDLAADKASKLVSRYIVVYVRMLEWTNPVGKFLFSVAMYDVIGPAGALVHRPRSRASECSGS